ncbi:MAG: hypothetical protein EZS28_046408 [Streblomastix strix]|uniref:C2H2-type domain-containing protein n=1 Tax=Streblomastix strix TaxID=222440 RepID=A0A5J4TKM8_9EUKA|nr:MAG: hypothetical protein EZS28_046408 [Streblomastix strix]
MLLKIAGQDPVDLKSFEQEQEIQKEPKPQKETTDCLVCKKSFNSQKALIQHCRSKNHRDKCAVVKVDPDLGLFPKKEPTPPPVSVDIVAKELEEVFQVEKEKEKVKEDQIENEKEKVKEDQIENEKEKDIDVEEDNKFQYDMKQCFICMNDFDSSELALIHMVEEHCLMIDEVSYVVDIEGLLEYLSEKINIGHICLACNHEFGSASSVKKHMMAKRHLYFIYEEDEYYDFYDFSTTYPEGYDDEDDDEDDEEEDGTIKEVDEEQEDDEEEDSNVDKPGQKWRKDKIKGMKEKRVIKEKIKEDNKNKQQMGIPQQLSLYPQPSISFSFSFSIQSSFTFSFSFSMAQTQYAIKNCWVRPC